MPLGQPQARISRRTAIAASGALGLSLASHQRQAVARSATPPSGPSVDLNVVYGDVDGTKLQLDVYLPAAETHPRPAVLLFHPGGMMDGDRTWMSDAALGLAEAGYVAFAVGYRLFLEGNNAWPAQLDDAQRAVRWVRANAETYNVNPRRIASYGHSAGAQLAAFLGTRDTRDNSDPELASYSSRTMAVVDLAGMMDMRIALSMSDEETLLSVDELLGGTVSAAPSEATYLDFSPIMFVDESSAPFLILQGGNDNAARIAASRAMESALIDAGVQSVYGEYPTYDHYIWDWKHSGPMTLAFLGELLKP